MLKLKKFSSKEIILLDGNSEYILIADEGEEFIEDIVESILKYGDNLIYYSNLKRN